MSRYFVSFTRVSDDGNSFGFGNCYMNIDRLDEESIRDAHRYIEELESINKNPVITSIVLIEEEKDIDDKYKADRILSQKIAKIQRDAWNGFGIVTSIQVLVQSEVERTMRELYSKCDTPLKKDFDDCHYESPKEKA